MNVILDEMVARARQQDVLQAAAQARLVKEARAQRPTRRDALRAYLNNIFMVVGRRFKALAALASAIVSFK